MMLRSKAAPAPSGHATPPCAWPSRQQQQQREQQQRRRCTRVHSSPPQQQQQQQQQRPLEISRSIAGARAAEALRPDALFADAWGATLAAAAGAAGGGAEQQQQQQGAVDQASLDVVATRYIDDSLANAMQATSVNSIQGGDYRQVVLFGDGYDTRPFRLLWPPGTLLFCVAPAEVHELAEAKLAGAQEPAHAARCLFRRVDMNLRAAEAAAAAAAAADGSSSSSSSSAGEAPSTAAAAAAAAAPQHGHPEQPSTVFADQLQRAGFRGDRLSVWALQGLHNSGVSPGVLRQLLAEVADCAAFHSLLVGELPGPLTRHAAEALLSEAGLLGAVYSHAEADGGQYGRVSSPQEAEQQEQQEQQPRWLFNAQQLRLSLAQMGIYDAWTAEFEATDFGDDYVGNVS